jgi:hypothetical protein
MDHFKVTDRHQQCDLETLCDMSSHISFPEKSTHETSIIILISNKRVGHVTQVLILGDLRHRYITAPDILLG